MFFTKKKGSEDDLKLVTENLYKQNLEIATKNKTLLLLSKLYEISLLALEPKELTSRMSLLIQQDFGFEFVGIFLYNSVNDEFSPLGTKSAERLNLLESKYQFFFNNSQIKTVTHGNFLRDVILEKKMNYTLKLSDIFDPSLESSFDKIESEGHIRSSIVYPLISENKIIGILILCLNRVYIDLSEHEKESISSFINVITIALDKAILYEKLKLANIELEEANSRQEGLIHFISHEIKGYLTRSLAAFAGILEGDYGKAPPPMESMIQNAIKETRRGVDTVIDILSASNLKKGTVSYEMKSFDFKSIVNEILDNMEPYAREKGLKLEKELAEDNFTYTGDKDQISKHVIRNLIDNSIKYTLEGSVLVKLTKQNEKIIFSVTDTGIGITTEDKKRLFTEGGRGKDSTKVNVSSTGYGLFIAKQIIEGHKGRIWAESKGEGKGSTFTVELPKTQTS